MKTSFVKLNEDVVIDAMDITAVERMPVTNVEDGSPAYYLNILFKNGREINVDVADMAKSPDIMTFLKL